MNSPEKLLGAVRKCSSELDLSVYSMVDYRPFGDMGSMIDIGGDINIAEFTNIYSMINEHLIPYGLMAGDRHLGYSLAEKAAKFSSSLADRDAYKHHMLGIAFMQIGDFREAKFEFEQSLLSDRNNPHGNILLGDCYVNLNDSESAMKSYESAVKCKLGIILIPQPKNIDYLRHYSLAMFHYKNEDYKDAAKSFEECIKLSPNDSGLYAKASLCYEAIGEYPGALQCIRYGLMRCPDTDALKLFEKRLSKRV